MKYPNVLESYNATILKRQEEGNYEFDTISKTTLYKWRKDTNYQDPFIGNDEVDDEELYGLVREYYEDVCDGNETDRGRTAFEGYVRSQGFHIHRDRQRAAVKELYPEEVEGRRHGPKPLRKKGRYQCPGKMATWSIDQSEKIPFFISVAGMDVYKFLKFW